MKSESISHSFAHTHAHVICTYSHQETSAKLSDHHKQEVTCCDYVIVLEDVHNIHFVFYEVQKFKNT